VEGRYSLVDLDIDGRLIQYSTVSADVECGEMDCTDRWRTAYGLHKMRGMLAS